MIPTAAYNNEPTYEQQQIEHSTRGGIAKKIHYDIASLSGVKLALEILQATENLSVEGERELGKAIFFLKQACDDFRGTIRLLEGETSLESPPERGDSVHGKVSLS